MVTIRSEKLLKIVQNTIDPHKYLY